jgi:hypothetical protein
LWACACRDSIGAAGGHRQNRYGDGDQSASAEKKLASVLIPPTKEELEPLARVWQGIVQAETQAISDKQIALLRNP